MALGADFIFLHGCQTTKGAVSFSSGLLGLASAFRVAGSRAVVASHWDVAARDEISQEVAIFYTRIVPDGQNMQESLRQLRSRLRNQSGIGRRPYAWVQSPSISKGLATRSLRRANRAV